MNESEIFKHFLWTEREDKKIHQTYAKCKELKINPDKMENTVEELNSLELMFKKCQRIFVMNKEEIEFHEEKQSNLLQYQRECMESIAILKKELKLALKHKEDCLRFDEIAAEIKKLPSRKSLEEKVRNNAQMVDTLKFHLLTCNNLILKRKNEFNDIIDRMEKSNESLINERMQIEKI